MVDPLTQEQLAYLQRKYTTPGSTASYSSPRIFYNEIKKEGKYKITYNQICNFLITQKGYYFHKQIRKAKKNIPIFSPYPKYMCECDLLSYVSLKKHNNNRQYALLIIDQASRKAFGRAIKQKSGDNVLNAMKSIFSSAHYYPEHIKFDSGREFINKKVKSFLESKNVEIVLGLNEASSKCSLIERLNLTLRIKLARLMSQRNTRVWYKYLAPTLRSYNSSPHRGINNLTPNSAWLMTPSELFMKVYKEYKEKKKKPHTKKLKRPRKTSYEERFKYKITDLVRVALQKDKFYKSDKISWSTEVYGIRERVLKNDIPTYFLSDLSPEKNFILGSFMEWEMMAAKPYSDKWEVEKVVKIFNENGVKYAKVRWRGFDRAYDSILRYSDIENQLQ